MKNLLKYAFAFVASALVLSACTDEYEYTPADAYDGIYLTADATNFTFTPADESQEFTFKVVRPHGGAAESISLTSDNELFTVPATVDFEAGQTEAEVTVSCSLEAGQSETLNITLPEGTYDLNYFSGSFSFSVSCDYVWEDAGTATFIEDVFVGFQKDVAVWHAQGTNMYVLKAPYSNGYDIAFYLDDDYNAAELPAVQPLGYNYSTYGMTYMRYLPEQGAVFMNEGNKFTMTCVISVSMNGGWGNFGVYANYFVWNDWPGAE